jgi:hypothetical protein
MLPRVPSLQPAAAETVAADEQNLSDLAGRLETALRKAGVLEIKS